MIFGCTILIPVWFAKLVNFKNLLLFMFQYFKFWNSLFSLKWRIKTLSFSSGHNYIRLTALHRLNPKLQSKNDIIGLNNPSQNLSFVQLGNGPRAIVSFSIRVVLVRRISVTLHRRFLHARKALSKTAFRRLPKRNLESFLSLNAVSTLVSKCVSVHKLI